MRKRLFILFQLLLTLNLVASAQTTTDLNAEVANRFIEYYKYGFDEKLYIQTDKPYYSTSDNIWFKGFLVNAITHAPLNLSNFIYVELTDTKGELFSRVEVKRDSLSGFSGYITLDPKMDAGDYTLRGYTKWMTNSDEELFFHKNITIISPIPEGSMAAQALGTDEPSAKQKREAAKEEKLREEQRLEYNLQFFPEGGGLVAGVPQLVAFKALAEDGLSIELRGTIFNSKGEEVTTIETFNNGMGFVQLNIPAGEQYYAEVRSAEYVSRRFDLPISLASEVALKVSRVGSNLYYQALASDPSLLDGVNAVIHSRGKIVTTSSIEMGVARKLSMDNLYDGVSVISLIDKDNKVISERIIFKKPTAMPSVTITPNSENYAMREKATINLQIKGSDGQPARGEFAVSVVDDKAIERDSTLDNSVSYLLLSSEIKGHVENPGSYFADNSKLSDSKLDLLMMTQGWRRFELEKILDPTANHRREVQYEDVVKIDGVVKGFFGNDARKPTISVACQRLNFVDSYDLDESNKFTLMDIDVPDSAIYVIQAVGKNGGKSVTIKIDPEVLPDPIAATILYRERAVVPFSFINQSIEKFSNEGGLQMIELDAVTVQTRKVSKIQNSSFASKTSSREQLEVWSSSTLESYLQAGYIGFSIEDNELYYRGDENPVNFYVNGMQMDYVSISFMTMDLVEEVAFFTEDEALGLYTNRTGGVFCIQLLDGAKLPSVGRPNITTYSSQGYQMVKKFYEPTYETNWKKENLPADFRTTIYWSGDIVPNENGEASFGFYTADKSTKYRVIVEGVTSSGEICHSEHIILRDKE